MALQRTKLWLVHDVRTSRWGQADGSRAPGAARRVSDFLRDLVSEFPYRSVGRFFIHIAEYSRNGQQVRTDRSGCGVCGLLGFRFVTADCAGRRAQTDSV